MIVKSGFLAVSRCQFDQKIMLPSKLLMNHHSDCYTYFLDGRLGVVAL